MRPLLDTHIWLWWIGEQLLPKREMAAAHLSRCLFLLTEDLQDRMHLSGMIVIDPFSTSWEAFAQESESSA
jgi:hypothetical protein